MIWLLFLIIGMAAFMSMLEQKRLNKMEQEIKKEIIVPVKQCPPHKWNYVEVKDTEGNTVKWNIVCELCGPLAPQGAPERMDY